MAGSEEVVEIRQLFQPAQFDEAVELQRTIWGFADADLLPSRMFVVADAVGGHVFGAYAGGRMIGFLVAVPGVKPSGQPFLHSHMLGVLPEFRDRGVGLDLKLRQRDDALARGIALVEWTFDPLNVKNAYFNLERLGAFTRRYVENHYGFTSSPLQGGLPTDRCVAEWWLSAPRVKAATAGDAAPREVTARVELPAGIEKIRGADPARARAVQQAAADQLQRHFAAGLTAVGFERGAATAAYLLGPWQ